MKELCELKAILVNTVSSKTASTIERERPRLKINTQLTKYI